MQKQTFKSPQATYLAGLYLTNCSKTVERITGMIDDSGLLPPNKLASAFKLEAVDPEKVVPGIYGNVLRLEVAPTDLQGIDWSEIAKQFTADLQYSLKQESASDWIRAMLADHTEVDGNVVRVTQQLDRQQYLLMDKMFKDLGGQWDRKAKGHVFAEDPTDRLESVALTGRWEKNKDFDFFQTPAWLAETVVELAMIQPGMRVLEPEAGEAAIASVIREHHPQAFLQVGELSDTRRAKLIAQGYDCVCTDFLDYNPGRIYDRIVMNPPFSRQLDLDHVMHAAQLIKPRGRLTAIMSAGIQFRENKKTVDFREWLRSHNGQVHDNPDKAFAESGTSVRTVTITADF